MFSPEMTDLHESPSHEGLVDELITKPFLLNAIETFAVYVFFFISLHSSAFFATKVNSTRDVPTSDKPFQAAAIWFCR